MGGEVLFALAIAGFPRELPKTIIAEVFRGGAEKVAEAGGVIAGGHTVVDAEPKYGLCVTGRVHPERILLKGGLRPGDHVFLSKPLGTGVIATAAKEGYAAADVLAGAVASMLRLNRVAAEVARATGARGLAEAGHWSGGMKRNRRHVDAVFGERLRIDPGVPAFLASLLTESETSGGLLFSVRPERAPEVLDGFGRRGEACWEVGRVIAEPAIHVLAS